MKKLIASLCILIGALSLLWNVATLLLTPEPGTTRTTTTVAPDGTTTTTTETLGKIVTISKLRAPEGTKLIVQNGGIYPMEAGHIASDGPLVPVINCVLAWTSSVLLLLAGLILRKSSETPKPETPSAPAPAA